MMKRLFFSLELRRDDRKSDGEIISREWGAYIMDSDETKVSDQLYTKATQNDKWK